MNKLASKIEIIDRKYFADDRGWFLKVLTGKENGLPQHTGEIYVTSAKPRFSKGGHFHLIATEWFTLIKGRATLLLVDIESGDKISMSLDSAIPQTVVVPPNIAHCFENNSDNEDYILLAYTDLLYDPKDTISFSIK